MGDKEQAVGNGQWATGDSDCLDGLQPPGFMEGGPIAEFRDLDVWKEGMELATSIYAATAGFPRAEVYGLTSQMHQASVARCPLPGAA